MVAPARRGSATRATPPPERTTDVQAAWRLAYVAIGDQALATRATTRAFAYLAADHDLSVPSRRDLLAATLRTSLRAAADSPGAGPDQVQGSAVTTAMWQLPPHQRAALWLTQVDELDEDDLGAVLGLSPANAEHVAERAAGWLDVALDHGSGPLCQHEPKLSDFLAGKLPLVEAAEIDDHLPGCPTCLSKVNAYEELADLPAVLRRAVPNPPAAITVEALEQQPADRAELAADRAPDLVSRPAAVRPLALCCAALLALGAVGAVILRPAHSTTTNPLSTNFTPSGDTQVAPTGGSSSSGTTAVPTSPTPATALVTTTTVQPAVTFPTVPRR